MWNKLFERLSEPSSYAGLAAIVIGLGQVGDVKEAPAVAGAVADAAAAAVAGGPWMGLITAVAGVAAVLVAEKGKRR